MQASRASARAFKAIAAGSKQTRSLHMTESKTFSNLLTSDRPALELARNTTSSAKEEIISRHSAHERAIKAVPAVTEAGKAVRHFNTSRSLKAVGDSSTIDFAFIPDFDPDARSAPVAIRVPILPETKAAKQTITEVEEEVMLPTIHTVAADGTHIHAPAAMSEVHDNNTVDFQGMTSQVTSKLTRPVEEGVGMARQIWSGFLDDIMGPKGHASA